LGKRKSYASDYVYDTERFRNDSSLSSLLDGVVRTDMRAHMSDAQRARAAWYGANGDVERKHTAGVFLDTSPVKKGRDPVLCVYVDSHARLSDFSANKEIYLARLHGYGLQVSGIRFRLSDSRHMRKAESGTYQTLGHREEKVELPELSAEQRRRVEDMTHDLPDGLREKARRAMELSLRRELLKRAGN
jgi:hypothetical protein